MSISEQVKKLKVESEYLEKDQEKRLAGILRKAADTIQTLTAKLADMERPEKDCGGGWIPCSETPKHNREVLIFNGKSYSVGYYDGKTWVNAIHPVEWQEIRHEP